MNKSQSKARANASSDKSDADRRATLYSTILRCLDTLEELEMKDNQTDAGEARTA